MERRLCGLEGMIMAASRLFTIIGGILWDRGLKILVILISALIKLFNNYTIICNCLRDVKDPRHNAINMKLEKGLIFLKKLGICFVVIFFVLVVFFFLLCRFLLLLQLLGLLLLL